MDRWTEVEFQRVSHETRITKRTLDACRDVLVNGLTGTEAAAKHQMFHAHISRALTTLRDKSAEVSLRTESTDVLKHLAQEIAKGVLGPSFTCRMAESGRQYVGPVVVSTNGFIVQKVGRHGVLHDKGSFESVPEQGKHVEVSYPEGGGRAAVRAIDAPAKNMAPDRDR